MKGGKVSYSGTPYGHRSAWGMRLNSCPKLECAQIGISFQWMGPVWIGCEYLGPEMASHVRCRMRHCERTS